MVNFTQSLFVAALVCSGVSFTITTTSIFAGFRELVSRIHPKLEELIFCPWCLSHYIAFAMLSFLKVPVVEVTGLWFLDALFTTFAIVTLSGLLHFVLLRAYKPVSETMAQRKIDKMLSVEVVDQSGQPMTEAEIRAGRAEHGVYG